VLLLFQELKLFITSENKSVFVIWWWWRSFWWKWSSISLL